MELHKKNFILIKKKITFIDSENKTFSFNVP